MTNITSARGGMKLFALTKIRDSSSTDITAQVNYV